MACTGQRPSSACSARPRVLNENSGTDAANHRLMPGFLQELFITRVWHPYPWWS